MPDLPSTHPQVKRNLLYIRLILGVVLGVFMVYRFQAPAPNVLFLSLLSAALLLSFTPFLWIKEEAWCKVAPQYAVFFGDLLLILATLYLTGRMETELLLSIFLALFISALSRSVAHSLVVALALIGLYSYHAYLLRPELDFTDPFLLLSFTLILVVAIEAGYLAYRVVQEEEELVSMARKMQALNQQVHEGNQVALEYAGTLKNVLDSFPLGAIAVSRQGEILFFNQTAGKLLDVNPKALLNISIHNGKLGSLGERMVQSLKDKTQIKREYMDVEWKGRLRRFRLDSSEGSVPNAGAWGTLFLIQEAAKPSGPENPAPQDSSTGPTPTA